MEINRREVLGGLFGMGIAGRGWCEDWPGWRGPRGDGTWQGPPLPERWPAAGLRIAWQQEVGGGYAGVSVRGQRLVTMDLEPAPPKLPPSPLPKTDGVQGFERVLCYSTADGQLLWQHKYPVVYGRLGGYANGPRSTPVLSADNKVYTLGAVGHLHCYDLVSGKVLWSVDTVRQLGARVPEWGFAGSPLLDGDRLIVHLGASNGGCVIAFDRHSGKEVWKALDDPAGYCNPVIFSTPTGRLLVLWTPQHIHGLEAATGRPLWKVPYPVTYGVSIATPLLRENILVVSGYWEGTKAIRIGPRLQDHELIWTDHRQLRALMAQPLYRDGYGYLLDKDYGLTCFEWKTGKKIWDDDNQLTPRGRNPHASIVWTGQENRALALNAVGELVLLRLHPRGYEESSRVKVLSERVWGHPAFAGRFLFAKTDGAESWRQAKKCKLICVELVSA
ncbi:MAG: dehydrogenase [Gemmataceae bacterium]|uniref:PQQ-like beta-propeller repeat protein n=1 Tax=Thermogemmata fonticola TaxID=2755323 RepID=A0A7V8VBD6_9BACT|nr:PQQ-binding-like beta-propeller repeat protein [Thermogemmata fonticola]MBA2224607.1 PQQ-like beta-propeller repeat protein [Thermogemmata fonticola]GIW85367.1 MAG: dehydrogenase [Gemmataceae bacterium]